MVVSPRHYFAGTPHHLAGTPLMDSIDYGIGKVK
jgi:hypothetical protein